MRLPTSDDLKIKTSIDEGVEFDLNKLKEKLQQVRHLAVHKSEQSKQKSKEHYDKEEKFKPYQVGQFVYLHDPTSKRGPRKKFAKSWKGPYEIIEVINKLNYKIKLKANEFLIVHYNRLKLSKTSTRTPRRVVKVLPRLDNYVNDTDPEQDFSVDQGPAMYHNEVSSSLTLPEPAVILAPQTPTNNNDNREVDSEEMDEIVEGVIDPEPIGYDDPTLNESIPIDPRDPEWMPQPTQRVDPGIPSQYNLRPRDRIVAPRRSLSE